MFKLKNISSENTQGKKKKVKENNFGTQAFGIPQKVHLNPKKGP